MVYGWLANLILVIHAGFIAYVVLGQLAILVGLALRQRWARNFWFRLSHLAAIGFVVVQTWLGAHCPLTIWENHLRRLAGQEPYRDGGFIANWLHWLIFFEAEPWVFNLAYTLFGALVLAVFLFAPPRWPWRTATST